MVIRSRENSIGAWAFFIGVVLAIIMGVFQSLFATEVSWIYIVLVFLGVLVGLMNMADKDIDKFLMAAVSLVIVSYAGQSALSAATKIGSVLGITLTALLVLFIPATIIVVLKTVFSISEN